MTTRRSTFLPFVSTSPAPPIKAGVAFSAHEQFAERVALLRGTVAHWRGWAVFGDAPIVTAGLEPTPCLASDFYYRPDTAYPLDNQLRLLDYLGAGYRGYLLFLNEPNESNLEIRQAVRMYVHARKVCPHARLVGPGISHVEHATGFPWLRQWLDAVITETGGLPQMTAWDIHNYIQDGDPLAPVNALQAVLQEYGVVDPKFFISEWGAVTPERTAEMRRAFDLSPLILRHYFYDQYMAVWDGENRPMQLFTEGHAPLRLSDIGEAFVQTGGG